MSRTRGAKAPATCRTPDLLEAVAWPDGKLRPSRSPPTNTDGGVRQQRGCPAADGVQSPSPRTMTSSDFERPGLPLLTADQEGRASGRHRRAQILTGRISAPSRRWPPPWPPGFPTRREDPIERIEVIAVRAEPTSSVATVASLPMWSPSDICAGWQEYPVSLAASVYSCP